MILFLACLSFATGAADPAWLLVYDKSVPQVRFAAAEIRRARPGLLIEHPLEGLARGAPMTIVIASGAASDKVAAALGVKPLAGRGAQAYAVRRAAENIIAVLGADANGAMYGGLDIAEAIRTKSLESVRDSEHSPHIAQRGIKFNIPLDVRTPSYSDNNYAAQANIGEMWSFDFWREMLDEMARHRLNVLSLWNLHPFPSLVKVPEFPDVALADVQRTRVPMDDTYSHGGVDMVRAELLRDVETVRTMSIEQKIQFWRDVMQYAADRGIDVYWFTWNMFVFGADGKHGITGAQDNLTTIAYFRASIREMVLTYPLLKGFGITAGEHMERRKDEFSDEKWLWKTYGEGVADAVKLQPGREVRMIHRYHQTAHDSILSEWKNYPGPFDLSFKYSIAHMYSIPNPPFIQPALPLLSPKLRTWLTVRDDDYYSFRWGDPEYARAYIGAMPGADKMAGFYMGPDGTTWGRESIQKEGDTPRQLEIARRWYAFMIWGRLSYEPSLGDDVFKRVLAARFPGVNAEMLFRTWSAGSKIFPHITRFFWGDIDLRWFPEACLSHPRHRGFYTVKDFILGDTMPGSGLMNVLDYRRRKLANEAMNAEGPVEIAAALAKYSAETFAGLRELRRGAAESRELRYVLGDLEAMAHLGNYYSAKILGAAELALFDKTANAAQRDAAVKHLQAALEHWKRYSGAYTLQYRQPLLYNRVGVVDIPKLTEKVEQDIAMARLWAPGSIPDAKPASQADRPFRK